MSDTECPYCGNEIEIIHDDGYGYSEDDIFQQECPACDKTFSFTTSISFNYHVEKAPCLNGLGHKFSPFSRYTGGGRESWERCSGCWEERKIE